MSEKEKLYEYAQAHDVVGGVEVSFRCPHCNKKIEIEVKEREGDSSVIEVYWGRNSEEIEKKQQRADEEEALK